MPTAESQVSFDDGDELFACFVLKRRLLKQTDTAPANDDENERERSALVSHGSAGEFSFAASFSNIQTGRVGYGQQAM